MWNHFHVDTGSTGYLPANENEMKSEMLQVSEIFGTIPKAKRCAYSQMKARAFEAHIDSDRKWIKFYFKKYFPIVSRTKLSICRVHKLQFAEATETLIMARRDNTISGFKFHLESMLNESVRRTGKNNEKRSSS